ncbi:DUF362 domain-containing protein [candidate division KSB1 bacterium]
MVRNSKVIDRTGKVRQPLLQEMLDKAMTTFTGHNSLSDAWRQFVSEEDITGLKLNTNGLMTITGTEFIDHFTAVTSAVITGMKKAGISDKNVVIWDRSDEEMDTAGYTVQKETGAMRVLGTFEKRRGQTGIGFGPEAFKIGDTTSHVSRIITDICTALINIPVLKNHSSLGVSCSLKNHFGSIDNPGYYHSIMATKPVIAEINSIPVIRNKQKLVIGDALLGLYEGGPRWGRDKIIPCGSIVVGTDPVAVDTVMLDIIEAKRAALDKLPIGLRAQQHMKLAENLGLGTANRDNIDLLNIDMS